MIIVLYQTDLQCLLVGENICACVSYVLLFFNLCNKNAKVCKCVWRGGGGVLR